MKQRGYLLGGLANNNWKYFDGYEIREFLAQSYNVKTEYDQLSKIFEKNFSKNTNAKRLFSDLKKINHKLWEIEDLIRDKERNKTFDKEFIKLARSVYFTNDDRARIKRTINDTLGSEIIEEKSYSDY